MCASPRANHSIRTMPPSASATYARGHDDAIWTTLQAMLGGMGDAEAAHARQVAALPGALGGLGLLCAEAIAPAAYWASWADALPAINAHLPSSAATYVRLLESGAGDGAHCLAEAANARRTLQEALERLPDMAYAARRSPSCPASGPWCGGLAGNTMHRGPLPYTLAIACFCLPCRPVRAHCSAPRQGRMPERGSPLRRATRQPVIASRHKPCKLRCGDAFACPCLFAPIAAAPALDVVEPWTL